MKGFRTHRLRDTFAVELLLAGVGIEDVSALLGAPEHPRDGAPLCSLEQCPQGFAWSRL